MRPAPRRPGNSWTWSVMRAPAESTSQNTGSSWRRACSVRRTIFSTVRAPHDPAFTVGSLAITHTGRPSMRPTPVTTPSAGRSSAVVVGQQAVLDERAGVEQQRQPVAHEQLVLRRRACRRPGPRLPARARSVSRASSSGECGDGAPVARGVVVRGHVRCDGWPGWPRRRSTARTAKSRAASSRFLHSTLGADVGVAAQRRWRCAPRRRSARRCAPRPGRRCRAAAGRRRRG